MNKEMHAESWLLQLATGTKKRFQHWVRYCAFDLNGMPTSVHLNVLPLGSCKMILGKEYMFTHWTNVDFYDKAIECLDDDG